MAQYKDAAAGWLIYRGVSGNITLEEINQALRDRGFRPIARRTFDHYQKLQRLGYEEYISINRLDLRHASGSVFDIVDRSRYGDHDVSVPAVLHVPAASDVRSLEGIVFRVSEGYASFQTPLTDAARAVARSTKYNRGVLVFTRVEVERAVRVREATEQNDAIELLLAFRSLLAPDVLFPDRVGDISASRLVVDLPDRPTMFSVVTSFHRSFDLYESLRGVLETIMSDEDVDDRPVLMAPRVRRLEAGSPFILDAVGSPWVWALVLALLPKVLPAVREGIGVAKDFQELHHTKSREDRAAERHRLEMESLQLDNLKKKIDLMSLLDSTDIPIVDDLAMDIENVIDQHQERLDSLMAQAIEAAAELAIEGSGEIQFSEIEDEDSER